MINGKTKEGFDYSIPKENYDNWEIVELLLEPNEQLAIVKVAPMLLGKEQYQKMKEFYRDKETGIVPASVLYKVISDIINNDNSLKNY